MTSKLHKYQRLWVGYVLDLGCNIETAKDIVQEFYVKMHLTKSDYLYNDDEPNFFGCYLILRNMIIDLKRKEKKYSIISDENIKDSIDEDYIESQELDDKYNALNEWLNKNTLSIESGVFEYDSDVLRKIYYKTIFEEIFYNNKKISVLSRETGISYYSLYNTVKRIKEQIKLIYEKNI